MSDTILDEAKSVVYGRGERDYGHPQKNFAHTAALWSAFLGHEITDEQVALMMILFKVSRLHNTYTRDGAADVAGYAATLERLREIKIEPAEAEPLRPAEPPRIRYTVLVSRCHGCDVRKPVEWATSPFSDSAWQFLCEECRGKPLGAGSAATNEPPGHTPPGVAEYVKFMSRYCQVANTQREED